MDQPQIDPDWMVHAKIAFAALCGGVVRLLFRPATGETIFDRFMKSLWLLFGCVTCGYFGTTPALEWFGISEGYAGATGALLGFVGLSLAEGLLHAADGFNVKQIVSKWAGGA